MKPLRKTPPKPPALAKPAPLQKPIAVQGTLHVKWVPSKNGKFAVGELDVSPLGYFKVKDSILEQFAEGTYSGTFWISHIFMGNYQRPGSMAIELRATLSDLRIDDEQELEGAQRTEPTEPDPVDEPAPVTQLAKPALVVAAHAKPEPTNRLASRGVVKDMGEEDLALFGAEINDLVSQRSPVKLDVATSDRLKLRRQSQRLQQIGYEFQSKRQQWIFATSKA